MIIFIREIVLIMIFHKLELKRILSKIKKIIIIIKKIMKIVIKNINKSKKDFKILKDTRTILIFLIKERSLIINVQMTILKNIHNL
jgi:hypothetical protein